jgi:hypothetical protein
MIAQDAIRVKVVEGEVPVTGFSGAVALSCLAQATGLFADAERHLGWIKERQRGRSVSSMLFDLMMIPCAGGECIDDLEALRADEGLRRLLGRTVTAPSTAHDFLREIGPAGLEDLSAIRHGQLCHAARTTGVRVATLDCDATLFLSKAQRAQRSYKGDRGWFPMLAFWAELGMVVHDEFRQGNASPQSDALEFLKEAVAQLPEGLDRIYVRSDSAWYQARLLDYCHEQGYGFAVTADLDEAVKTGLMEMGDVSWTPLEVSSDPGDTGSCSRQWACEGVHTLNGSSHPYRMIYLRRERRQGDLFEGMYSYGAIITNRNDLSLEELVHWHRQRCNCENHIKELKHGFGLASLPSGDFFVNAVYLRIMTLSFNLIASLKTTVLPESWSRHTLKTLRFRLLGVPALVVRHARRLHLRLSRRWPWRNVLVPLLA